MATQKQSDAARRNLKKANAARDDDKMTDSHKGSHSSSSHSSPSRSPGSHSGGSRNHSMDDDSDMDNE